MRPLLGWLLVLSLCGPAVALDRPWISTVFFYWYTWDYDQELGSWMGGIHNTPLDGYYDSRTFRDNRRSLWQASEWGVTHHFMDYWSPHWKGEGGEMREAIVMRAAESLRKEGYDIWMAYYQDGDNFEMQEFSRNVSEKRDVYQWLRDFAKSEVWPKIDGEPLQLVYARNGRPKTTIDHAGFRGFLKARHGAIAALNRTWRTSFGAFDEIEMSFGAKGHQRAESIEYQYEIWRREWEKLNGLVRKEFGLPGLRASFDVGYKPYMSFGFANFARVLGGPHSYAGIFGPPDDQDAERENADVRRLEAAAPRSSTTSRASTTTGTFACRAPRFCRIRTTSIGSGWDRWRGTAKLSCTSPGTSGGKAPTSSHATSSGRRTARRTSSTPPL